jgi:hypothetical protein
MPASLIRRLKPILCACELGRKSGPINRYLPAKSLQIVQRISIAYQGTYLFKTGKLERQYMAGDQLRTIAGSTLSAIAPALPKDFSKLQPPPGLPGVAAMKV